MLGVRTGYLHRLVPGSTIPPQVISLRSEAFCYKVDHFFFTSQEEAVVPGAGKPSVGCVWSCASAHKVCQWREIGKVVLREPPKRAREAPASI